VWFPGLLWLWSAWAGERVTLPEGEDAALWRVPFSLTGLEVVSASGGEAKVHIDATASGWVLRATGADGVVRTARIAAPQTAADREEVAFLARGLMRAIEADAAAVPGPLPVKLPPPPLPPPPASAAVATPEAEPPVRVPSVPAPRKIGPVEVVPEGTADVPVIALTIEVEVEVTVVPSAPRFDPLPLRVAEPVVSAPEPVSVGGSSRRRKDRRKGVRLGVPPVGVSSGVAVRPGSQVAALFSAGMDIARIGRAELGWDLVFMTPRGLPLEPGIPRRYHALDWQLEVMTPITSWMRVGADGGGSFRWYRQQNTPITTGNMLVPVLGAKTAFGLVPVGNWAIDLIGGVQMDLMETRLVYQGGLSENLVPVEFRAEISFRWWTKGDPFAADPTSKR
jgi:hypothetical protein